jgi:hypothetical protein
MPVRTFAFRGISFPLLTVPSRECIKHDLRNGPLFNMNLLKNAYLQPEMQVKEGTKF